MPAAPTVPESCLACGACCFGDLPDYVRVSGNDHARLGEHAETLTVWKDNRCFLRMEDGHCAALRVDRERGELPCSIYALRPETCRSFERGSPECLGELARKAERPRRLLRDGR